MAFMLFGREMTSNDLSGPGVAPTSTPLGPQTTAVIPPPVIAASTLTAPKFNFVSSLGGS